MTIQENIEELRGDEMEPMQIIVKNLIGGSE